MNNDQVRNLTESLIPQPEKIKFIPGPGYLLTDNCQVMLHTRADSKNLCETAAELFSAYWNISPEIHISSGIEPAGSSCEAYDISISEQELSITFRSFSGFLNAMKTLRQLAMANRGPEKLTGYFLAQCEIHDRPAMEFRGIHLCIFPETPLWDIEKQIRLAAYHKFNYAVIEPWGVFPFESHPEFCWHDKKLGRSELKSLIRLGKKLGITLIPQINVLGHATAARGITCKHAVLDYHPELQPLFEPDGWSWCLSNPHVRVVQSDLVTEIYEFFDSPPFFHIGCDEAHTAGNCPECSKQALKDLIRDHILFFHELFRKKDARIIMWHDMLLEQNDPRWKGYTAFGPGPHLKDLYDELPRDIIIADWQYDYKTGPGLSEPTWPTAKFFKNEKFDVMVCPWLNEDGITSLARMAAKENLFGLLETTWHISHDREYMKIYFTAAGAAWNPAGDFDSSSYNKNFRRRMALGHHVRQIGWDMELREYEKTGFSQNQVDPGTHPHPVF